MQLQSGCPPRATGCPSLCISAGRGCARQTMAMMCMNAHSECMAWHVSVTCASHVAAITARASLPHTADARTAGARGLPPQVATPLFKSYVAVLVYVASARLPDDADADAVRGARPGAAGRPPSTAPPRRGRPPLQRRCAPGASRARPWRPRLLDDKTTCLLERTACMRA